MKVLTKYGYLCVFFAVIVLFCAPNPSLLQAQQKDSGVISGTVQDPVGGAVQNATVVVRSESSGAEARATTDQAGKFSVPNLPAGNYTVEVSAPGFALADRQGVKATTDRAEDLTIPLTLGSVSDAITVEAATSGSIAAQHAPMDGLLEARSARTEVTPIFIQNLTSPLADFGELVEMAPGTFSINSNGIGLGQDKTYFRGFPDGDYDIDFDGVPFYDTNSPTHHTWAFFPDPWTGSVDFDRSPGSASTIGPTPFGGSIHLLSPELTNAPLLQGSVSYGSFNTELYDLSVDSGAFGGKKSNLLVDVQHMQSKGYETDNFQNRDAGMLKYVYKFSENNVLTGFSGVVWLDANTPNNNPTRGQIGTYGYNFLNSSDFNASEINSSGFCVVQANCLFPLNYKFYTYHVPTDFEYVDWTKQWGRGWQTDFKPYTLSYYNAQYYDNPSLNSDGVTFSTKTAPVSAFSAVDKLNSYRKYGETLTISEVSKYGIFRTGLWYEWATTNRFQIPSDPLNRVDAILPNFHETFYTNSYQPFAEYEYHVTQKLTITAGFKYSYFNQNLTQDQDNGKTVGCLGGALSAGTKATETCVGGLPSVNHSAGYSSYLPSFDANYHIMSHWSVYGQFGKGTIVPPSSVFDVKNADVLVTPTPTGVSTYQGGTVLKLKQVTLNADVYYTKFQNAYTSIPDSNNTSAVDYVASGDSVTTGFEGEANVYITHGLSFYANGTVGKAHYVNTGLWVANTPSDTEAFGLTYQQKHFDFGIFDKRVGSMWNDLSLANNIVANQIIPINPFSVTNVYLNYVLRNGSRWDQTKFRLSVNNVFNSRGIVGDQQASNAYTSQATAVYAPGGADLLTLLPGRSITLTISPTFSPSR
ncbi:MAG TPA: TonB-dependent receptor [Candidatus Acidoferrales bacterium]|jgi:iron complex outermembrane receptor protein|nr:TonB-dependent receptor [Candidatus Acidoferrales bacterium]